MQACRCEFSFKVGFGRLRVLGSRIRVLVAVRVAFSTDFLLEVLRRRRAASVGSSISLPREGYVRFLRWFCFPSLFVTFCSRLVRQKIK